MNNKQLTKEQRKELNRIKTTMEVSALEIELLEKMRTITHGKFSVQIIEGVPVRYEIIISRLLEV